MYAGTVNDFIPQPVASAVALLKGFHDPKLMRGLTNSPAYIYLLSAILTIAGVSPIKLNTIPILAFPYFCSFLAFAYALSDKKNSKLIVLLLALIMLSNGLIGSGRVSIYTHGFGVVLYYSAITILLSYMTKNQNPKLGILFVILGTTLVMLSYDVSYKLIGLIVSLIFIMYFANISGNRTFEKKLIKSTFLLLATPLTVLLSYGYIYKTFLPIFKSEASFFNVLIVILKFQTQYLGHNTDFLRGLALRYPTVMTTIYTIKYMIYITPIFIAGILLIQMKTANLNKITLYIYVSILASSVMYAIAKTLLEQIVLSWVFTLFLVSVLFLTYYIHDKRATKFIVYVVLALLISLNMVSIQLASDYGIIHKDPLYYPYVVLSAEWGLVHYERDLTVPDVFTYSWVLIAYSECGISCHGKTPTYLPDRYVFNLYSEGRLPRDILTPVNYRSEYVELFAWRTLKSFKSYRPAIQTNPSVTGIVYSLNSDFVMIYTG